MLHKTPWFFLLLIGCGVAGESTTEKKYPLAFEQQTFIPEGAVWWWARNHADVNGDGLTDLLFIQNNAQGGFLGWYETHPDLKGATLHTIAETGPNGGTFACGDLASADIDGDGDIDVLGPVSKGEWGGSSEPMTMYWYENPSWAPHPIGTFPTFVKDVDLVDLNGDGKVDLAGTCFDAHKMVVFRQDDVDNWTMVADVMVPTLHEGQHVGDLDGDGDVDVVSTGFWFENPGDDMTGEWVARNIDPYWNSDTGRTWQFNATKIVCMDIDGDNKDEVFISCSEMFRDLVAWYDNDDPHNETWTRHEIGRNEQSHTLQVGDIDLDGDLDVLSGNNGDQGDPENSPVLIFLNQGDNLTWEPMELTRTGAYNSYLADVEGDGDLDFFRYDGHECKFYELWVNGVVQP